MEVVELDQDCWWAELKDRCYVDLRAPMKCFSVKIKEEGGSARVSPVAAPMPKSDSS